MAQLPPAEQTKFVAQHKAALIKQLNFQPTQLQLLRANQQQLTAARERGGASWSPSTNPSVAPASSLLATSKPAVEDASTAAKKRPASSSLSTEPLPSLVKHKKVAWVESQIKKDQHEAVSPNCQVPFRSKEDACKRLLRYHVFHELAQSPAETRKAEDAFETKSAALLAKAEAMLNKYHYLLLQESTVSI